MMGLQRQAELFDHRCGQPLAIARSLNPIEIVIIISHVYLPFKNTWSLLTEFLLFQWGNSVILLEFLLAFLTGVCYNFTDQPFPCRRIPNSFAKRWTSLFPNAIF